MPTEPTDDEERSEPHDERPMLRYDDLPRSAYAADESNAATAELGPCLCDESVADADGNFPPLAE